MRTQGNFPAVGEVLEPFTTAWTVEGWGYLNSANIGPIWSWADGGNSTKLTFNADGSATFTVNSIKTCFSKTASNFLRDSIPNFLIAFP